jgi:mRNA-degrading endonuclease RelE of RelBE toxin-antitoxin system
MQGSKVQVEFKNSVLKQVKKAPNEIREAFPDMVEKVQSMTLDEVRKDMGLDFEKVLSRPSEKLFTLRINRNWRAICKLRTGPIIEIIAVADHTKTHAIRR